MPRSLTLPALLLATFTAGVAVGRSGGPARAAAAQPPARVFELRTYYTEEGRLPALQQRFREHTTKLFERHGMTNVGYWVPRDTARKNTLVYLLAYPSREAARESWAAFGRDPEWVRVRTASEADGKIVQRVESVFLDPTDYSPMK